MVSRYASEQCFYVREMGVRTMTAFLLDTHRDNDVLVVVVSAEIDMAIAPTLMAAASVRAGAARRRVAALGHVPGVVPRLQRARRPREPPRGRHCAREVDDRVEVPARATPNHRARQAAVTAGHRAR